jgi:hypothetical protein
LFEKYLNLNTQFNNVLQSRQQYSLTQENTFESFVDPSVAEGVNIPNDTIRAMAKEYAGDANLTSIDIAKENILIGALNKMIAQSADSKTQASTAFYTRNQAVATMQDMMSGYDALDYLTQQTNITYNDYLNSSQNTDSLITQALAALQKNADEYSYEQALSAVTYQPAPQITIPQVQIPQTTNCNISYTGVHGNYNVTCN